MRLVLFIAGSGTGACSRYLIEKYFRSRFNFPFGILLVNVVGSFILGLAAANSKTDSLFLIFGFCGALTSWSALALDFEQKLKSRKYFQLTINLLANLILGISAALIGQSFA